MRDGVRLAIFTPVKGAYNGLAAVVFGITYSLGVVYTGIAFVPLSIAKPVVRILQRRSDDAGSTDVASVDLSDDPTEIANVHAVDDSTDVAISDSVDDSAELANVEPTDVPGNAPIDPLIEDSNPDDDSSASSGFTASPEITRSGFLEKLRNSLSAIRQLSRIIRRSTVTISMEEDVIRIVVFRGSRIHDWDYITMTPPNGNASEETESPSDSTRFREALAGLNIQRARLVTDLPLFTSLERHFHLPHAARSYVEPMVIAEVLDTIPFGSDEVDISWHSQKVQEGHEVVAVAAPRSAIDGQVRFARGAGLTPRGAYSKASALALASGIPDAILIHNQPSETGVVLVRGGSPIVVHHLETPSPDSGPQERANSLSVAVDQVLGFYQTLVPGADNGDLPVVMTGQVVEDGSNDEILTQTLGREILACPPPLRSPEEFPASEYAANTGLWLADRAGGNPWGKGPLRMGPTPNLLPVRHLPQGLPAQAFLIFVVLILMGAAINPTTVQVESLVQQADNLTAELGPLRSDVRDRRTEVGLESDAKKELEDVNQQIAALESRIADLNDEMVTLLGRLESITQTSLPSGVTLASLAPGQGGFALNGSADSHDGILQYAANLRASDLFSNATIEEITGSTKDSSGSGLLFRILATIEVKQEPVEQVPSEPESETK